MLSVDGLSVSYRAGEPVARQLSFDIGAGEVVGLLGESGCGKTTTALAILNLLPAGAHLEGSVRFRGIELVSATEGVLRKIRGAQISFIPQEPLLSLNPVIRVIDQVGEVVRAHTNLGRRESRGRARAALLEVGLEPESLHAAYPHQLSGGQRQRVLIAQAIVCHPALLIADEPTGSLDGESAREILRLLRGFVDRREMSMLLITHDPEVLEAIADRAMVMQNGQIVQSGKVGDVLQAPRPAYRQRAERAEQEQRAPALLTIRGLRKTYQRRGLLFRERSEVQALRGIDLELDEREILAITGASGSGKSTLARCIAGLEKPSSGEIKPAAPGQVQLIFQDPGASLNPRFTVAEALKEPAIIRGSAKQVNVPERLEQVGLPQTAAGRLTAQLSGGEKARLALARALAALGEGDEPGILILDESLGSLDLSTRTQIIQLLLDLRARRSLAYIVITHDRKLAAQLADEVAVMSGGEMVARTERADRG